MEQADKSQVEVSERINDLAKMISGDGEIFLKNARLITLQSLARKPYNNETKAHEAEIRWRRTADQILRDEWVYQGKSCTDLTIVYIALCNARGLETRS